MASQRRFTRARAAIAAGVRLLRSKTRGQVVAPLEFGGRVHRTVAGVPVVADPSMPVGVVELRDRGKVRARLELERQDGGGDAA